MKTIEEFSDFCNEFAFYDHYNIDRVIKLNYVHEFINIILSESNFKHEYNRITLMAIIDDISLKVTDGDVENIEHEMKNLISAISQMLCSETL